MNILVFFLHFRNDFLAQPYPTLILNWAILLYFVDVLVLYNLNILIKILCYGLRIERFTIARSILTTKTGRLQGRNSLRSFNLVIRHFCKLLPSSLFLPLLQTSQELRMLSPSLCSQRSQCNCSYLLFSIVRNVISVSSAKSQVTKTFKNLKTFQKSENFSKIWKLLLKEI